MKIQNFTDLNAWKEAHKLVLNIYKLTKKFPKEETYGLSDQMRRCAVSITLNIAEDFSRQGKKEKLQFYFMSKGSLTELQNQLLVAKDVKYLNNNIFKTVGNQTVTVNKLLTGLIRSTKSK